MRIELRRPLPSQPTFGALVWWCSRFVLSKCVTSFLSTYVLNTLLQTLSGKQPFFHLNEFQAAKAVASDGKIPDQNRHPRFPHDDACWQIMGDCWHREPSRRKEMCTLSQDLNILKSWHQMLSFRPLHDTLISYISIHCYVQFRRVLRDESGMKETLTTNMFSKV